MVEGKHLMLKNIFRVLLSRSTVKEGWLMEFYVKQNLSAAHSNLQLKELQRENRTAAIVNIKSSWMAIGASLQFSGQKQHPCKAFEGLLLYWRTQELK